MSTREDREEDARQDAIYESQHPVDLVCPSCGGDGEVRASYGLINWDEPRWNKCPECYGTGVIDPDDYEAPYSEQL